MGFLVLVGPLVCLGQRPQKSVSSFERAQLHGLTYPKPAVNFFEGAVLGNGGMGVVVTTRPDAVVLRFGHNNVWDIRVAEANQEKLGTFQEIFDRVSQIPDTLPSLTQDPWFKSYATMARENYAKPYPRPFPCGSVLLGFDRREVELLGHTLSVQDGLCEVQFLFKEEKESATLQLFVDRTRDRLWMRVIDAKDQPLTKKLFNRLRVLPDPSTPKEFPRYQVQTDTAAGVLSFQQTLPYQVPEQYDPQRGHPRDRAFALTVRVNSTLGTKARPNWEGRWQPMGRLENTLEAEGNLVGYVDLREGLAAELATTGTWPDAPPSHDQYQSTYQQNRRHWQDYWARSGVQLSDSFLEQIWYRNLYFMHCAVREGVTCPGLFANWSYQDIGTSWHGDYHFNYNTQQPFWVTFSSNHLEQNLPYVELVNNLLPVCQQWAKEYYGLRGAYFFHSAYPVDMTTNPYPVPTWGWEISETPWTVQSLWWHYRYSMDTTFLQERAYIPMQQAVRFLVDYMKRPEASGPPRWNDDAYHIFPTVPPELYGLRPGFAYNYDCLADLTLTKYLFQAFREATRVLGTEGQERALLRDVETILTHFPKYPTARTKTGKEVFVSVPGEHPDMVYNVPVPLMTSFPGDEHGLHSAPDTLALLRNTLHHSAIEGANDLVFHSLQAARLGALDLEAFKRHVAYCLLPNGTATDRTLQVGGRLHDETAFDFHDKMGIWFENFALPAVINECMLQSYTDTLRLFPNWPDQGIAQFATLRTMGAFLVSAEKRDGRITFFEVFSEKGGLLKVYTPWPTGARLHRGRKVERVSGRVLMIETEPGETLRFTPLKK